MKIVSNPTSISQKNRKNKKISKQNKKQKIKS